MIRNRIVSPTSSVLPSFLFALGWCLAGCGVTTLDEYEVCTLDLALTPASGAPGTEIAVVGTTLTEIWDTRVMVGGVRATVTAVTREGCDDCDVCRDEAGCAPCGLCAGVGIDDPALREDCFGDPLSDPPTLGFCASCVETMAFVVPDMAPGLTSVLIVNRNGQSEATPFEVLPGAPGTGDTSDTATGTGDTATGTGDTATGTGDTAVDPTSIP